MNFPPGQDYANRAVSKYNAETQKIDVIMYRVTDKRHSDAMIAAKARGIPIRYLGETVEYRDPDRLWVAWNMDRMYAAGIPMRVRASDGQNHEKVVLLHAQGLTCLLVEQDATLALEATTRSYVFRTGRVVAEGSSAELRRNPLVEEIYLGGDGPVPC